MAQYSAAPEMTIDTEKSYTATIQTSKGDVVIDLFPEEAPLSVNNFVFLAREGFYNNVKFHRIIKGFMIQGSTGSPCRGDFFEIPIFLSDRRGNQTVGYVTLMYEEKN